MNDDFEAFLRSEGYADVKLYPEGGFYVGIRALMFHWTMHLGMIGNLAFYEDAWCYEDEAKARAAFEAWDPESEPEPTGWHRHPKTGRRRPGGDPNQEFIWY